MVDQEEIIELKNIIESPDKIRISPSSKRILNFDPKIPNEIADITTPKDTISNTKKETLEKNLYLAKFCLEIEKYDDAIRYIDDIIKTKDDELTEEERNIFVMIYRCYITEQRNSWKTIYNQEEKEKLTKSKYYSLLIEIRNSIEEVIKNTSERIIHLINNYILKKVHSNEGKAFFFKVKGDYYRYLSEVSYGEALSAARQNALQNYKDSVTFSSDIQPLNIIKLGNFLNFAVFQYEVMNNTTAALNLARQALNDAAIELKIVGSDALLADELKDSLTIVQILKENYKNWISENEEQMYTNAK